MVIENGRWGWVGFGLLEPPTAYIVWEEGIGGLGGEDKLHFVLDPICNLDCQSTHTCKFEYIQREIQLGNSYFLPV